MAAPRSTQGSDKTPSLLRFYENVANVRNICIVAHVDHGKTTLADSLLASNGIISSRLAGQLRFMDSREDEQRRGITMKSSVITLLHRQDQDTFLLNLIDSPGHVDFASEVSAAARLSDGAVVVVDVVEGVSAQTHAVLRQAWREGVQPCLVLNKIDRLITELQLEPSEAFQHLRRTLEQVNVVMAALFAADAMAAQDRAAERAEERQRHQSKETLHMDGSSAEGEEIAAGEEVEEERSDDALYFEPERGNVVFASAVDGWGFTVEDFAEFLAEKMGCKAAALRRCLWGDFFLTKEKGKMQVKPGAEAKGKPPMFARFVLQNIWDVYAAAESRDKPMLDKISHALGVKLPPRVTQQGTTRGVLQAVFSQWLPLARAVMKMACNVLPSPQALDPRRVMRLLYGTRPRSSFSAATQALEAPLEACRGRGDPAAGVKEPECVAFVSKMVALSRGDLPELKRRAASLSAKEQQQK